VDQISTDSIAVDHIGARFEMFASRVHVYCGNSLREDGIEDVSHSSHDLEEIGKEMSRISFAGTKASAWSVRVHVHWEVRTSAGRGSFAIYS
jgi:hypothetical protein